MTDSPALKPLSRQVIVPLARPILPTTVQISGPGPIEPTKEVAASDSKPTLPAPGDADNLIDAGSNGDHADGEGEDDYLTSHAGSSDPYANLDGAFGTGGYTADAPKPHTDDLLF